MSIKIEQLLPLLKKGWVAMDDSYNWYYFSDQPHMRFYINTGHWDSFTSIVVCLSDSFDIEPVKIWTQSLMECGK